MDSIPGRIVLHAVANSDKKWVYAKWHSLAKKLGELKDEDVWFKLLLQKISSQICPQIVKHKGTDWNVFFSQKIGVWACRGGDLKFKPLSSKTRGTAQIQIWIPLTYIVQNRFGN
jgi:hypothetical protein